MDGQEIIKKGLEILEEMELVEDNELKDRETKLRVKKDQVIELVKDVNKISYGDIGSAEIRKSKAMVHYILGKAFELNFDPSIIPFHKEALKMLKRSVLLDSSLEKAWNALGHYYQKERNFSQSLTCYEKSLRQKKNKEALHGLSTVVRNLEQENRFELSVVHAKDAIKLDFNCPKSWYVLGNSYLYHYFSTHSEEDMEKAIKAFNRSESLIKDRYLSIVPDINHNRSILLFFEGDYETAYQGFHKSYEIDPKLEDSRVKMIQIRQFMKKIEGLTKEKRSKRFMKGLKEMKTVSTIDNIVQKQVTLKVVALVSDSNSIPLVYLCVDKNLKYCILSIYFIESKVLKDEGYITILAPKFEKRSLFLKDPVQEIHSIKVRRLDLVRIDGKKVKRKHLISATMSSTYQK